MAMGFGIGYSKYIVSVKCHKVVSGGVSDTMSRVI